MLLINQSIGMFDVDCSENENKELFGAQVRGGGDTWQHFSDLLRQNRYSDTEQDDCW